MNEKISIYDSDIRRIIEDVNIFRKSNIDCYIRYSENNINNPHNTNNNIQQNILDLPILSIIKLIVHTRCKYDLTYDEIKKGIVNKNVVFKINLTDSFRKLIFYNLKIYQKIDDVMNSNSQTYKNYNTFKLYLMKILNVYFSLAEGNISDDEFTFLNTSYTNCVYDQSFESNVLLETFKQQYIKNCAEEIGLKFISTLNENYVCSNADMNKNNIYNVISSNVTNNTKRTELINHMKNMIVKTKVNLNEKIITNENNHNIKIKPKTKRYDMNKSYYKKNNTRYSTKSSTKYITKSKSNKANWRS